MITQYGVILGPQLGFATVVVASRHPETLKLKYIYIGPCFIT
jgi:hypothetical protein